MAAAHNVQPPFAVDLGHASVHLLGQRRFGKRKIQLSEDRQIIRDGVRFRRDLRGKCPENLLDLHFFRRNQLLQLVADFDDGHRLDEHRRAG